MQLSKKQYEYLLFAVVIALAVFRFSYQGLWYIPYLDDYTQYLYYPSLQNNLQRVYTGGAGVLFTRPLAGLFDRLIWSRFWGALGAAVVVISLLHGISAVLFYKGLKLCGCNLSPLFLVLYIMMPVNVEATYWLSASSRIVVSMFFVSLSVYFAASRRCVLFFIFNFLSVWFYEQTAALGIFLSLWCSIRQKKLWWTVMPLLSAALLILFYLKFGFLGDNAHRISLANPSKIWQNAIDTAGELAEVICVIQPRILCRGFLRGFEKTALDFSLFWLGCLAAFSLLFYTLSGKAEHKAKVQRLDCISGVFFVMVPLAPFLITGAGGFNLRNAAPCILGMSVLIDRLSGVVLKKYACAAGALMVFFFAVAAVSETVDYSNTAAMDLKLAAQIAKNVEADTKRVALEVKTPVYYEQNAPYRDHIMSMTGSDWALTGIVRALSKNEKVIVERKTDKNSF